LVGGKKPTSVKKNEHSMRKNGRFHVVLLSKMGIIQKMKHELNIGKSKNRKRKKRCSKKSTKEGRVIRETVAFFQQKGRKSQCSGQRAEGNTPCFADRERRSKGVVTRT